MSNIPALVKRTIQQELRGVYTASLCVVEEFDADAMRVRVSLKRDQEAIMGPIPVATPYATGDGYGMVAPIEAGDEGLLLHTKEPLDELIVDPGHQEFDLGQTMFDINDAVFFPRYFNDNDDTPVDVYSDFKKGDLLIAHAADTFLHVKGDEHNDPGTTTVETASGQKIVLDEGAGQISIEGTVVLGDPATAKPALTEDAVFEYEDTQPNGSTQTKTTSTVSNGEATQDTKLS